MQLSEAITQLTGDAPTIGTKLWEAVTGNTFAKNLRTGSLDEVSKHAMESGNLVGMEANAPTKMPMMDFAAGGGEAAAAAGPIGLVVAAAMAVNAGFDKVADGLGDANEKVVDFTKDMATAVGVPKSIANLGASVLNLVSPLKLAENGIKLFQFAMMPVLNLDKPGEILKSTLTGLADIGSKLVTVFVDLRDPAAMLTSAVGPFVNQVNKFNPGIVDRMNIAFDNASAASGRMFEPIIIAATEFADELNVVYTALSEPVRGLVTEVVGPVKEMARELLGGFAGLARDGIPVVRQLISDMAPLAPMARTLVQGFFQATSGVIKFGGELVSGAMSFIGPLVEGARPFVAILFEGGRILGTLWGMATDFGQALGRGVSFFADLIGAGSILNTLYQNTVTNLQMFTAALRATAESMRSIIESPGQGPQELARGWGLEFQLAMRRMNAPAPGAAPVPTGPMSIAAQQARHVGIEDVGVQARAAAFSQGSDPASATAENTQQTAENTQEIIRVLQLNNQNLMNQIAANQIAGAGAS